MVEPLANPAPAMDRRAFRGTSLLLLACFVFSHADKQIMGLLVAPIQASFGLNDGQVGLLQGLAFAMVYALAGLPIARLIDTGRRLRIAAACVAMWSLATMLCGLAGGFAALLACRAATAFAEAGLPPAAFSIFSQASDSRQVARMSSIFMLAPFLGGGLALVGGGWVLGQLAHSPISLWGWSEPWRVVLLVIGAPGLVLAFLLVTRGCEPARAPIKAAQPPPPLANVLATIFVRQQALGVYILAITAFSIFLYGFIAWYPTYLIRHFEIPTSKAGGLAGSTYLVFGVLGTLAASLVAGRRKDDSIKGLIEGFLWVCVLLGPVGVGLCLVPHLEVSIALYAAYAFLSAFIVSLMVVPLQLSLPNRVQARAIAIFSFLTTAIGGSTGPLVVGLLSGRTSLSLGTALATTAFVSMAATITLLALTLLSLRTSNARRGPA